MSILVELTSEDAKILLESYQKKKLELTAELTRLTSKMAELTKLIKGANENVNRVVQPELIPAVSSITQFTTRVALEFNEDMTWKEKILFVMARIKRPVTTREIVDTLALYDPKQHRDTAVKSVSATLSEGAKSGIFFKSLNDKNENQYEEGL